MPPMMPPIFLDLGKRHRMRLDNNLANIRCFVYVFWILLDVFGRRNGAG